MRFIQNETTPKKEPKPKKKEVVIKAGNKDYDYANLTDTKEVLTGRGSF